jgi:molybdopterin converting factor small subunit
MVTVRLATPLRKFSDGKPEIQASGKTIREIIENIDKAKPGFKERIIENGEIKQFINIFHNNEDVRFKKGLDTEVAEDDVISILPAVSGG